MYNFDKIINTISLAGKNRETVEIYYPKTWRKEEGWREVEPYSLTTDLPPEGEHLCPDKDHIKAGHILNAYTIGSENSHCHSFILGKIVKARRTGRKFTSRKNWKIEF